MPFLDFLASFSARPAGGSGYIFRDNIAVNTQNYNLRTRAQAAGWNTTSPLLATVVVQPGVTVSSSSSATPSFDTGSMPNGSQLTLINGGAIYGAGGAGGNASSGGGGAGGNAINAQCRMVLNNLGIIGGGGGGGGAGASYTTLIGGSGGGGGAGNIIGTGGTRATGTIANGIAGNAGTLQTGGGGGPSVGTGIVIFLSTGTEFTSNAVYESSFGANSYWWSINISGTITSQGQGSTKAWVTGSKLFATTGSDSSLNRSNFVGEYAITADYTGAVATYTVPNGVPDVGGLVAPTTVFAELYGGGSWGGYTRINLATTSQTYWYCVGPNGGETYTGFAGQTRFRWDRGGCNNNQDQRGAGWTGLFNAHPYGNTTNYTDTSTLIANSGIYGIAGGGTASNAAGGGTTGGGRGGTQTAPGGSYIENINNACASSCTDAGTSEAVFSVCPSRLIGQWVAGGFETCTYGSGSGGYFPGGSWTTGGCGGTNAGGGSGYVGAIAGAGSFTQNGSGANPTSSPYFVTSGRIVFRIR